MLESAESLKNDFSVIALSDSFDSMYIEASFMN